MLAAIGNESFAQEVPGGPDGHARQGSTPDDAGRHAPRAPDDAPIPHRDWHRGDRLPADYRSHSYVVDDWRDDGLQSPPRGYHWVNVNGDYVLVAVATGVIANILLSPHR
ncbi:Ni/Co efflux regulator RcnB [Paraburkholderia phenoliruptrix]|uniref:RcnB family protein n=1 Tax=Paraburkholderia phenoliruptrix TaxID=252970 RepID=UPI0028580AA7|nr:RcnB family protein [Paraburkholderia phenoliruptrix]MDR6422618.1 Ni/Co efflux regulator RcnB [Paraburkholderia phenoliruptrix]